MAISSDIIPLASLVTLVNDAKGINDIKSDGNVEMVKHNAGLILNHFEIIEASE